MPRIPFFKAGRSTPVLDSRITDTPSPARQPTTAQRLYNSPTPKRSVTLGTIILDTPPGPPCPFAPRVKVRDFAYLPQGRSTPVRPQRPECLLFETDEERFTMEQRMGLLIEVGTLKRSHSRSTSCPTSALPMKALAHTTARSRASSHPLLADIPSTPPPVVTEPTAAVLITPLTMPKATHRTPEGKKRPAALKLHSSNLTHLELYRLLPLLYASLVLESFCLPPKDSQRRTMRRLWSRSGSADNYSSIPFRLDRRISRSTSDLKDIGGPCHSGAIFEQLPTSTPTPPRRTPITSTHDTFCSEPESSVSQPSTTPSALRSFENIPLPWSLVPSASLDPVLFKTYKQSPGSSMPSPRLLPPKILSTCLSESSRLTSELNRLKTKYAKLLHQRDHSLRELQTSIGRNNLESLVMLGQKVERQVTRCDRVARQMYVCNDQIRQIEAQMVEHRVGVWQLRGVRAEKEECADKVERLTGNGQSEEAQTRLQYLGIRDVRQDRSSTVSLGYIDDLTFPLPPTRVVDDSTQDTKPQLTVLPSSMLPLSKCPQVDNGMLLEEQGHPPQPIWTETVDDDQDNEDSLTTQTDETSGTDCLLSPNAILIYPPNHCRSASVPLLSIPGSLDMPHTPYIGDRSDRSEWDGEDTRRAIPGRTRGIPPLRFAVKSKAGKGRCQSMILARDVKVEQKVQKRESELNTSSSLYVAHRMLLILKPDSILLSLATAQMWTREM